MIDIFDTDDEGGKCGDGNDDDDMMVMKVATSYSEKEYTHFRDES